MHGTPTQLQARRAAQSARLKAIRSGITEAVSVHVKVSNIKQAAVVHYKVCRFNRKHIYDISNIDVRIKLIWYLANNSY